ncbi:hypothetical protein SPRG_03417 [Saprolegnia parasitica CBS 223.65]|uniref:Uncharacterized protein n=1 Tax=Saprolegnia parasitica (strain CBS 223.65) TaxID=695850 RepID=A0A067CSK2_SAPPC|nr:hypothetical protein SPRG_03417 [Saprolegnia parasitica CBS 223.65]KDO32200.1 hypothetical protein SPRG_03417 [Saprolegnia parasitica CBS 223.65]|eukprot:XP_012197380.1 hypothetical protein SPRG_03417 [Saprolegnia parasitica CBS 223.65]
MHTAPRTLGLAVVAIVVAAPVVAGSLFVDLAATVIGLTALLWLRALQAAVVRDQHIKLLRPTSSAHLAPLRKHSQGESPRSRCHSASMLIKMPSSSPTSRACPRCHALLPASDHVWWSKRRLRCGSCKAAWCLSCAGTYHFLPRCHRRSASRVFAKPSV